MMIVASLARSRTLIRCPGSGQPLAFLNVLLVRPSSWPRLVICSLKASSVPPSASATTMQASLPDCTMIPCRRSSTRTRDPTSTNIFEPPLRHAFSLTGRVSSRLRLPSARRSKTISTVISLLIDAGGTGRSAFLA